VTQTVPVRHGGWWYHERPVPGQSFWLRYRLPAKGLNQEASSCNKANNSSIAGCSDGAGRLAVASSSMRRPPNSSKLHQHRTAAKHGGADRSGVTGRRLFFYSGSRAGRASMHHAYPRQPPSAAAPNSQQQRPWDETGPDWQADIQVVLDPNHECSAAAETATSHSTSGSGVYCDVFGVTVSPNGETRRVWC